MVHCANTYNFLWLFYFHLLLAARRPLENYNVRLYEFFKFPLHRHKTLELY